MSRGAAALLLIFLTICKLYVITIDLLSLVRAGT